MYLQKLIFQILKESESAKQTAFSLPNYVKFLRSINFSKANGRENLQHTNLFIEVDKLAHFRSLNYRELICMSVQLANSKASSI